MRDIADLDAALKAVAPVVGVSFGRRDDKATWRIDFEPSVTAEQRAAAQVVVDGFDPASEPQRWFVPMVVVTQRIVDAGLSAAARAAIDANADMAITWPSLDGVWSDDVRVRNFIAGIGGDADALLAASAESEPS